VNRVSPKFPSEADVHGANPEVLSDAAHALRCLASWLSPEHVKSSPRFKVIAIYTDKVDQAHISFVKEANGRFTAMAAEHLQLSLDHQLQRIERPNTSPADRSYKFWIRTPRGPLNEPHSSNTWTMAGGV